MTMTTQAVIRVFLEDPSAPRYGFDIAREAGIATGSLYPILARLERLGWVESYWEEQGASDLGRPRRRYYRLTASGVTNGSAELQAMLRKVVPTRWRLAGGGA